MNKQTVDGRSYLNDIMAMVSDGSTVETRIAAVSYLMKFCKQVSLRQVCPSTNNLLIKEMKCLKIIIALK